MSNYQYGQDILQDVLFRSGEKTELTGGNVSDYLAAAKRYVMRAYYDILREYAFPAAMADPPGIISTVDKVTGTVTCTKGNTAITFSTTITPSMAGRKFFIDNEQIIYRIATHVSGTDAATLDATYKEDTTTEAFTIYQDEYSLAANCLRPVIGWSRSDPTQKIDFLSAEMESDTRTFTNTESDHIKEAVVIRGNKIRVRPWSTNAITIEYDYVKRPDTLTWDGSSSTDTPILPEENRHIIADYALVFLMRDKNDSRADTQMQLARAAFLSVKAKAVADQKPRFYPKPGSGIWR